MVDYNEQRQKYYREREGKVYGIWKVLRVEHDEKGEDGQAWTIQCTKCGMVRTITYGKSWKKKGQCNYCKKCSPKPRKERPKKPKPPTLKEKLQSHVGEIIDGWQILGMEEYKGYKCECIDCGRVVYKKMRTLLEHQESKCLCKTNITKYTDEYIGRRYGRLQVVGVSSKLFGNHKRIVFDCQCDCGNKRQFRPVFLEQGMIVCCGSDCKYKQENVKLQEGSSKELLYKKWQGMKARCFDKKSPAYPLYGGRGIRVCDEWKDDYVTFRKWAYANGYDPNADSKDMSIDRINPDGNYEPSNCRFITMRENSSLARHTGLTIISGYTEFRKTKYCDVEVEVDGIMCDLKTACIIKGLKMPTILMRVHRNGMSWQEAIDMPLKVKGRPRNKEDK